MTTRASGHALEIAEKVAATWYSTGQHLGQRLEIAHGIVAAASLIRMPDITNGPAIAGLWEHGSDTDTEARIRLIWKLRYIESPYLVEAAGPLHAWLDDKSLDTPQTWATVRAVMSTALRAGILTLTGSENPALRCEADVLGTVLTHMRCHGARKVLGEYHTPADVADLISHILGEDWSTAMAVDMSALKPGAGIADVCAGTGGLMRAAANHMHQHGATPADFRWYMQDIDGLAVPLSAVNAITWGLVNTRGDNVLVHRGDVLADGDGIDEQRQNLRRALDNHRTRFTAARYLAAEQRLMKGGAA